MRGYIYSRFLQTIATVLASLALTFVIFRILPGDPVILLFRSAALSQEAIAKLRHEFGLDQPIYVQFFYFLRDAMQGNFGVSFSRGQSVVTILLERLPYTVLLMGLATVLATLLGVTLGVIAGWRRESRLDRAVVGVSIGFYAAPLFWFAGMMILLGAVYGNLFPVFGATSSRLQYTGFGSFGVDVLHHLLLPLITLTLAYTAPYVLIMRNSMVDILGEDFVLLDRAKGLGDSRVMRTAARNALLPTSTLMALNMGWVLAGGIQIETVFGWPGIGRLTWDALMTHDFPILQGVFIVFTISMILANLFGDILLAFLDPRIRY
jgi:peptide/nickel transport system permease protein